MRRFVPVVIAPVLFVRRSHGLLWVRTQGLHPICVHQRNLRTNNPYEHPAKIARGAPTFRTP